VRSDPLGLMFTPADAAAEAIMFGVRGLRGGLEGMLNQYAANMEADLDWAMDWSAPDDAYSRLRNDWVATTFHDGMTRGFREAFDDLTYGAFADGDDDDSGPTIAGRARPFRNLPGLGAKGLTAGVKVTMGRHGLSEAGRLIEKARASGVAQGWFTVSEVHLKRFLSNFPLRSGVLTVPLPRIMAKVAMPDGSVRAATRVRLIPGGRDGRSLGHAYPMP